MILDLIVATKREEIEAARRERPESELRALARDAPPPRGFRRALAASPHPVALIAEIKRASPSEGEIRADFDPVLLAQAYSEAEADALSVLTDRRYFRGDPRHLRAARAAVPLPVLRKDFVLESYQIHEARALGADAVLLIAALLDGDRLREFREQAEEYGMDALVEVHDEEECERALLSGARLVGVNNRDLRTFETRLETSERLLPHIAGRALAVSESALSSAEDVRRVQSAGARAVLIGTAFCRAEDVVARVREVMGWPESRFAV